MRFYPFVMVMLVMLHVHVSNFTTLRPCASSQIVSIQPAGSLRLTLSRWLRKFFPAPLEISQTWGCKRVAVLFDPLCFFGWRWILRRKYGTRDWLWSQIQVWFQKFPTSHTGHFCSLKWGTAAPRSWLVPITCFGERLPI